MKKNSENWKKTPNQSGFYIASADKSGKVRIWDTVNKEHILKYEYQPFAGEIRDLAWDGESKVWCLNFILISE